MAFNLILRQAKFTQIYNPFQYFFTALEAARELSLPRLDDEAWRLSPHLTLPSAEVYMVSNTKDAMADAIARMRFVMTATEAREQGICVKCKQPVLPLENVVISHYQDSALCESCFSTYSPRCERSKMVQEKL